MAIKLKTQNSKLKTLVSLRDIVFILIIILPLFCNILAVEVNNLLEVFNDANKLYSQVDYNGAAEKYQSLIDSGVKNTTVYYNLGNSYYKNGKLAMALLNYRRAFKLSPRDKDISANLKFVREKVVDQIKYEKPLPEILWEKIIYFFTFSEWVILCSIFYLLFMFILIFSCFKKESVSSISSLKNLIFIMSFITFIFSLSSYSNNQKKEAVMTAEQVEVRNGPGSNYSTGFVLHEGTEVECSRESEDWIEITLPNGLKGWVEKSTLQII